MYSKKRKCKCKTCSRKSCSRKSCKGGTVGTVDVKLYHSPYTYKYLNKKWVLKNDA